MTEEDPKTSFTELDARLRAARSREDERVTRETATAPEKPGAGAAMRIAVEMISALLVSGGIGWFLDDWLGTRPWVMLAMLLVGCGIGLRNTYRTAMRLNADLHEGIPSDQQDPAKPPED
jgi:ATP synthase protein I